MELNEILIVCAFLVLAIWRRHPFLYLLCVPLLAWFGFQWGQTYIVQGVACVAVAIYCLYQGIAETLDR